MNIDGENCHYKLQRSRESLLGHILLLLLSVFDGLESCRNSIA